MVNGDCIFDLHRYMYQVCCMLVGRLVNWIQVCSYIHMMKLHILSTISSTYSHAQTHRSTGDERVPLDEPHKLTRKHFEQVLDADAALELVTLTPLYPCINTSKRS